MTAATDSVRLKTSDQPVIRREKARGDGVTSDWKLELDTVLSSYAVQVRVDNILQTDPTDYTVDYNNGIILFTAAPVLNSNLIFQYMGVVYTDAEIEVFLTEAGGNTDFAAAKNLMAWAANAAKLAKKESLSGGGGIGAVTLDLAVRAEQLRAAAKAYMDLYKDTAVDTIYGPAEGITEPIWTEQMVSRTIEQELIRNSE